MKAPRPGPAAHAGVAPEGGEIGRGDTAAVDRRRARSPRRLALARAAAAAAAAVIAVVLGLAASEERASAITPAAAPEPPAVAVPQAVPEAMPAAVAAAGSIAAPAAAMPPAQSAPPQSAAALPAGPAAPADARLAAGPGGVPEPDRGAGVWLPRAAGTGGRGYLVQLGVFTDPANALELYERAAAAGQPAHIQSRVVLGPFPDRAAAERARKAHQALGAGVVVAPGRSR